MSKVISIHPVTRIEGHAKISIYVDDAGAVQSAQFHVTEFRGFEKLCQGRPFYEMPGLMSRICGICPVSHVIASSKAGDQLLGVDPPPTAVKLRMLVNYAQLLQSHALSFFHLSAPDIWVGMDAPPEKRNIFGLAEQDPDFVRRGIRLRQFGQRIIEMAGGKKIHPSWGVPGGVARPLLEAHCDEIKGTLVDAWQSVMVALGRIKDTLDSFRPEIESMGNFPSLFLATVTETGGLEYYDGAIRIVDNEGNIVAQALEPTRFEGYLAEASEEWSYMKFPYYKPLGYPGGMYRVGPLARLNVAKHAGTPFADRELREFKQRAAAGPGMPAGSVQESFYYHLARAIEMLHAVERIGELAEDPELLGHRVLTHASLNRTHGIGSCEAPRGTLFHHYEVDDTGLMRHANLLIATSQNNLAMNKAVEQAARRFVNPLRLEEGMLNRVEATIRCFDPCLSCSTHAVGQMPMVIEIRSLNGDVINRIERA